MIIRATQGGAGSNTATIVVSKPAGTAQGDLMVLHITSQTGAHTWTTLAGWTLKETVAIDDGGGNVLRSSLFYKIAGASEPSTYTFTPSINVDCTYTIASCYIIDATTPINAEASATTFDVTVNSTLSPSVTPTFASPLLLLWFCNDKATTWTPPSGTTELQDRKTDGTPAADCSEEMCFAILDGAGPTAQYSATPAAASVYGLSISVAAIIGEQQDVRRRTIKIAGVSSNVTIRLKESI